jgi:sensor histidine kinase YesM
MLLQPFVENAVIHGIAAIDFQGHILISFSIVNHMLCCTIQDNGIGRKKSTEINTYRLHQSQGISITQQRLALLSEKCSLTIEDVVNNRGLVAGTKVTVCLPLLFKD